MTVYTASNFQRYEECKSNNICFESYNTPNGSTYGTTVIIIGSELGYSSSNPDVTLKNTHKKYLNAIIFLQL